MFSSAPTDCAWWKTDREGNENRTRIKWNHNSPTISTASNYCEAAPMGSNKSRNVKMYMLGWSAGGSHRGRHIRRHRGLSHALLFKRGVHYLCRRKRRDIKQRPSTIITIVYKSAQPLITKYSWVSVSSKASAFVRRILQDSDRWAQAKPCRMYFRREEKEGRKQPQKGRASRADGWRACLVRTLGWKW